MTSRTAFRRVMDDGWAAIGFLTVLPVPEQRAEHGRGHATAYFPLVGIALGLGAAGISRTPMDPFIAAILAVAFLFVVTGGLHWDAWADVLDATVTPGLSREKRLEILGDPRAGAHAAVGVALLALASVAALGHAPIWGVVLGATLGRWVMVATLRWAPSLRDTGAGARMRGEARPFWGALGPALLIAVLLTRGVAPTALLVTVACGAVTAVLFSFFLVSRLRGMNGDAHGAVGLLTEVVVWVVSAELQARGHV